MVSSPVAVGLASTFRRFARDLTLLVGDTRWLGVRVRMPSEPEGVLMAFRFLPEPMLLAARDGV